MSDVNNDNGLSFSYKALGADDYNDLNTKTNGLGDYLLSVAKKPNVQQAIANKSSTTETSIEDQFKQIQQMKAARGYENLKLSQHGLTDMDYLRQGMTPEQIMASYEKLATNMKGGLGEVVAGTSTGLNALAFGIPNAIEKKTNPQNYDYLRQLEKEHPTGAMIGEGLGTLGSAAATGGVAGGLIKGAGVLPAIGKAGIAAATQAVPRAVSQAVETGDIPAAVEGGVEDLALGTGLGVALPAVKDLVPLLIKKGVPALGAKLIAGAGIASPYIISTILKIAQDPANTGKILLNSLTSLIPTILAEVVTLRKSGLPVPKEKIDFVSKGIQQLEQMKSPEADAILNKIKPEYAKLNALYGEKITPTIETKPSIFNNFVAPAAASLAAQAQPVVTSLRGINEMPDTTTTPTNQTPTAPAGQTGTPATPTPATPTPATPTPAVVPTKKQDVMVGKYKASSQYANSESYQNMVNDLIEQRWTNEVKPKQDKATLLKSQGINVPNGYLVGPEKMTLDQYKEYIAGRTSGFDPNFEKTSELLYPGDAVSDPSLSSRRSNFTTAMKAATIGQNLKWDLALKAFVPMSGVGGIAQQLETLTGKGNANEVQNNKKQLVLMVAQAISGKSNPDPASLATAEDKLKTIAKQNISAADKAQQVYALMQQYGTQFNLLGDLGLLDENNPYSPQPVKLQ